VWKRPLLSPLSPMLPLLSPRPPFFPKMRQRVFPSEGPRGHPPPTIYPLSPQAFFLSLDTPHLVLISYKKMEVVNMFHQSRSRSFSVPQNPFSRTESPLIEANRFTNFVDVCRFSSPFCRMFFFFYRWVLSPYFGQNPFCFFFPRNFPERSAPLF